MEIAPIYIGASQVNQLLSWMLIIEAVEEALISVVNEEPTATAEQPYSNQPQRSITKCGVNSKLLFSMPSFVGDYKLSVPGNETASKRKHSTLATKLVTSFRGNDKLAQPLPNIMANILLFSVETGQLQCIMDGTQITAWRTAGASIVATKYLYHYRFPEQTALPIKVAIIGCGVQGQSHALGMCATYNVTDIYLWNRTRRKAEVLQQMLSAQYPNINVVVSTTPAEAVEHADVINVGTYSPVSLVNLDMIKKERVHINTVGAGEVHFGEVDQSIYDNATVYVDSWQNAKAELAGLKANIVAEVGEVILSQNYPPMKGITIFQSMGMGVEDATVAQAVFDAYARKV